MEHEIRFFSCEACGGDGGWEELSNFVTDLHTGAPYSIWIDCPYCRKGLMETRVEPITLEDLDIMCGT